MKKILKIFIVIMLILNITSLTVLADSNEYTFNQYGMRNEVKSKRNTSSNENWESFNEQSSIPLNKNWTITFSDDVTKDKIDGMVIEKGNKFIPVDIEIKGSNTATIKPTNSYESNSKYTLKVFLNNGKRYKMHFNTVVENTANYKVKESDYGIEINISLSNSSKLKEVRNVRVNGNMWKPRIEDNMLKFLLSEASHRVSLVEVIMNDGDIITAERIVDKTKLITAINIALITDIKGKTQTTISALDKAIKTAKDIRDADNSRQNEIDLAIININEAIFNLKDQETPTDRDYFSFKDGVIIGYSSKGPIEVVIPEYIDDERVTAIGVRAFYKKNIVKISIPEGVKEIREYAFYENQITSLILPNSLIALGQDSFSWNKITKVSLSDNLTYIGDSAFKRNNISEVDIPDGVTSIGSFAFNENSIKRVTIPDSVISIGAAAFTYNNFYSVSLSKNTSLDKQYYPFDRGVTINLR